MATTTTKFTKQLSEPTVVQAPSLQTNTGSTATDLASAASFGLQAYQMFQNKEALELQSQAKQQKLLLSQQDEAESMKGVQFANDLVANLSQIDNPSKRKMFKLKSESEFLQTNKDNPLAIEAYFKTTKGRGITSGVVEAQEARILQENRLAEQENKLILEGKQLVAGMSTDPEYQELLATLGDNIPDSAYRSLALQQQGRKELLAAKTAELNYASGQYSFNRLKSENERVDGERLAKNKVTAESQVKVNDIATRIRVPMVLLNSTSDPQQRVKSAQVLRNSIGKAKEELDRYVDGLSPEESRLLDTSALYNQFNTITKHYEAFTDPEKVNKYSEEAINQGVLALMSNQLIEGSPNGQSVALSVITGMPLNEASYSQFQREVRNGQVPFKILGDAVSKVYDGNYTDSKQTLKAFDGVSKLPETMGAEEKGGFVASFITASSNPIHGLHEPKSQVVLDRFLDEALETPESTEAFKRGVEQRGGDTVEVVLKSFKNYIRGTLTPSLASLRNEGVSGLDVELDGKGNIVLNVTAQRAEQFGNQAPQFNIAGAVVPPSLPLQLNVKASRVAREVSVDLNKRIDKLSVLMPDVDRATIAQILLDGTKLAFKPNQEQKDN